ncbi:virion assembly protein [Brazilian porcupinepox virus 1]|nr:virion assembly protein [Brazilian porcupinepox virus 1]
MTEEDINESNFMHLLESISNKTEDTEFSATLSTIREIINQINLRILTINKKSKKNTNQIDQNYAQRRENYNNRS